MIPPLPLGRSESSWLHQSFVARALANAPSNTLLGEALPPVNPDEADLHRQERVHLAHLQCGHHLALRSYESRLRPEVDPACRWCGEGQETISHIFQECPQLAVELADAGVSNPRDLWDAPAVAEICRDHWAHPRTLLEGVRGTPHLGIRESVLGRMRWLLRHSKKVREGLINNNNNITHRHTL